jgi:hypothetical protein
MNDRMDSLSTSEGGPASLPGETWYPRGRALVRKIIECQIRENGNRMVTYRTKHGEFTTSEREFQFWIERLSASTSGPSALGSG